MRDKGIDLIAFADLDTQVKSFVACPIQMKAASESSFAVHQKYAKFPNLILAYIWYLKDPRKTVTYALTYREAVQVADDMGWATTDSWKKSGYSTQKPSNKLLNLIDEYKMSSHKWWAKVTGMS